MAIFQCLHRYEEKPQHVTIHGITGDVTFIPSHPEIIPAEFRIISGEHKELRNIGEWIMNRDVEAVISVTDSADGRKHSFTVRIYDKETIVLLRLIWA